MILGLAVTAALAEPVRHAIVVGANDGGGTLEPLRYAETDAQAFANLIVELGGFDESLVTVLYAPTADELRRALASHAVLAEQFPEDVFLFYYSGHADAAGLRLAEDTYYFETLKEDLHHVDADVRVGVLDACRSGAITRLKGAAVTPSIFTGPDAVAEGEAWITASSADELAQESDDLRGGFFSHYLMSGMRGAADTGDGLVDLTEAYRYTFDRVVARTGGTTGGAQHPGFSYDLSGSGDLALTDVRKASALLVLPADSAGLVTVLRLPDRVPLVEVGKLAGAELELGLGEGRYLVRRRDTKGLYEFAVTLNRAQRLRVEEWGEPKPEFSTARGEATPEERPRLEALVLESLTRERALHLKDQPALAGLASLAIPGAGQVYNGQYGRGALYFLGTAGLMAGTWFAVNDAEKIDPRVFPMLGLAVWGASIADGVYGVHRREDHRPVTGWTLGYGGSYGGGDFPFHHGLSADAIVRPGFSVGLDRVGYTAWSGGFDTQLGSRLMIAYEGGRLRPGVFTNFALRVGEVGGSTSVRAVAGAGADLRYYVTPRYFVETDARLEYDGAVLVGSGGVGFGVHIGRNTYTPTDKERARAEKRRAKHAKGED